MALDDLDLEFEDEDEAAKKKKNDAVSVDVDLEFHVQDHGIKPRPTRPNGTALHDLGENTKPVPTPVGEVKKLDEARPQPVKKTVTPVPGPKSQPVRPVEASKVVGATALKSAPAIDHDFESEEVVQLRERVQKAEFDAEVKVQVAEYKVELLGELLGDMKLMDHQINQLLVRINAKHPDLKQEVLMIKKILADFTSKKRK